MYEDTLARVRLFSSLDRKELQALARACQERKYSAGDVLIKQGDSGAGLFVITNGRVKVTRVVNPDKPEEELHVAGPGEVLGEMALLDDLPRSANITAVDDVTVLLLPIWEFRTTLRNHPEIAFKLLATLSHRIRRLEESHSSNH